MDHETDINRLSDIHVVDRSLRQVLAPVGTWLPVEGLVILPRLGLKFVYVTGGLPAARSALSALWREPPLAIDLLMVVAASAAAIVGVPFEGAVLLSLFSVSSTLEHMRSRERAGTSRP